jgi:GT2 family glycosyltransferase
MTSDLVVVVPSAGRVDGAPTRRAVVGWPVIWVDDSAGDSADEGADGVGGPGDTEVLRTWGLGFAGAANCGLARAESRGFAWALLLNDDAVPEPGCVEALRAAVDGIGVVAAGPVLEGPDGVESAGLRYHEPTARLRQQTRVPDDAGPVDALSGACLLVPTDVRFDEDFPHAMEDVDLARRLRAAGGTLVIVPSARCWHTGGGSVDRRSRGAARDAVRGHLRLAGDSRVRRGLVVAYALAQVAREGGPVARVLGVLEGVRT